MLRNKFYNLGHNCYMISKDILVTLRLTNNYHDYRSCLQISVNLNFL